MLEILGSIASPSSTTRRIFNTNYRDWRGTDFREGNKVRLLGPWNEFICRMGAIAPFFPTLEPGCTRTVFRIEGLIGVPKIDAKSSYEQFIDVSANLQHIAEHETHQIRQGELFLLLKKGDCCHEQSQDLLVGCPCWGWLLRSRDSIVENVLRGSISRTMPEDRAGARALSGLGG
jgi:hypothetical protein